MGNSLALWVVPTTFHFILRHIPFLNFLSKGWSCKIKSLNENHKQKGVSNKLFSSRQFNIFPYSLAWVPGRIFMPLGYYKLRGNLTSSQTRNRQKTTGLAHQHRRLYIHLLYSNPAIICISLLSILYFNLFSDSGLQQIQPYLSVDF